MSESPFKSEKSTIIVDFFNKKVPEFDRTYALLNAHVITPAFNNAVPLLTDRTLLNSISMTKYIHQTYVIIGSTEAEIKGLAKQPFKSPKGTLITLTRSDYVTYAALTTVARLNGKSVESERLLMMLLLTLYGTLHVKYFGKIFMVPDKNSGFRSTASQQLKNSERYLLSNSSGMMSNQNYIVRFGNMWNVLNEYRKNFFQKESEFKNTDVFVQQRMLQDLWVKLNAFIKRYRQYIGEVIKSGKYLNILEEAPGDFDMTDVKNITGDIISLTSQAMQALSVFDSDISRQVKSISTISFQESELRLILEFALKNCNDLRYLIQTLLVEYGSPDVRSINFLAKAQLVARKKARPTDEQVRIAEILERFLSASEAYRTSGRDKTRSDYKVAFMFYLAILIQKHS